MKTSTVLLIIKILDLMALALPVADQIRIDIKELLARLRTMNEEGRDPMPKEWDYLFGEANRLSDAIQKQLPLPLPTVEDDEE